MKTMKRMLAAVLALVMTMGFAATVMAADEPSPASAPTGTIEISAAENTKMYDEATGLDRTFDIYRIFDAQVDGDAVSYDWIANPSAGATATDREKYLFYSFFYGASADDATARIQESSVSGNKLAAVMKYVRDNVSANASSAAKLATDLMTYINSNETLKAAVKAEPTLVKSPTKYTYGNLEYGYYLVNETTANADVPHSALMINTVSTTPAQITLKVIQPTIEKEIVGVKHPNGDTPVTIYAGTSGTGVNGISAQVGDVIEYCVDLAVPDIATAINAHGFYWYHFKEQENDAVLDLVDETEYSLKLVKSNGNVETLILNEDYLVLPDTYEDVLKIIDHQQLPDGSPAPEKQVRITRQLIVYLFGTQQQRDALMSYNDTELVNAVNGIVHSANTPLTAVTYPQFTHNGGGIVFRLTTSSKFAHGDTIKVYIEATVKDNKDAEVQYVDNDAHLYYTKDPTKPLNSGNIGDIDDDAKVYTHELDIVKIAQNTTTPLTGAKFKLERVINPGQTNETVMPVSFIQLSKMSSGKYKVAPDDYTGTTVDEIEVSDNNDSKGHLDIAGLGAGTYRLTEIEAPAGYNIPENPFVFTISANYNSNSGEITNLVAQATSAADSATGAEITGIIADFSTNLIKANVTNQKGGQLPSTGGTGTWMFTLFGGTFAVVLMFFLVTEIKKKKQH